MENHFANLLKTGWKFADKKQLKLFFVYLMFVVSDLINLTSPIIFGLVINALQKGDSGSLSYILILLGIYYAIPFFFWIFHGVARVWERQRSFSIVRNFTLCLFEKITLLPLEWHKNYHSGDTIDRVKKSYTALKEFSENTSKSNLDNYEVDCGNYCYYRYFLAGGHYFCGGLCHSVLGYSFF